MTQLLSAQAPSFRAGEGDPCVSGPRSGPSWRTALVLDVLSDGRQGSAAAGGGEVRRRPQVVSVGADRGPLPKPTAGHAFQRVHQPGDGYLGRVLDKEMNVVVFPVALDQGCPEIGTHLVEHLAQEVVVFSGEHATPILGHKDQMNVHPENTVSTCSVVLCCRHSSVCYIDFRAGQVSLPD